MKNGQLPGPSWYRWIYSHWGGKPWTWLVRDYQRKNPLLVMLAFMVLGIILAGTGQWWGLALFVLGVVIGHFWW